MLGKGWKNVGENVWKMLEKRRGKMLGTSWKNVGENDGKMLEKRRGTCWKIVGEMLEKGQDTCCKIVSADVGDLLSQGLEIFL